MAQYVMQYLVEQAGIADRFYIESAATSREEIGNPVHYGTRAKLRQVGIPCGDHRARQMTVQDYDRYDYLIGMDRTNLNNMMRILHADPQHKVSRLLDFTSSPGDIADPWYTDNFDATYSDVLRGCRALLEKIMNQSNV